MNIPIFKGQFSVQEAELLIQKMMEMKIKFHEEKINSDSSEEEIKMREQRIIQIQNDMKELKAYLSHEKRATISVNGSIEL